MQLETGEPLYQIMLARYYGAGTGRFVSVDRGQPFLMHPSSWNRYSYTENNPINRFDPDGLAWIGQRPLETRWRLLVESVRADAFHQQIFFDDGSPDQGFFDDGKIRSDDPKNTSKYLAGVTGLDDDTMHAAVKSVSGRWKSRKYSATKCNCQDFVGAVLDEYNRLQSERKKGKAPDGNGSKSGDGTSTTPDGPVPSDDSGAGGASALEGALA